MQTSNRRHVSKHVISVVLAICASIVTIVLITSLIVIIEFARITSNTGYVLIESVAILFLATTPCFFICKRNPESVWYVPLIVNLAVLTICGIMLTGTWSLTAKIILLITSMLLATYLSILGAKKGRT